MLSSAGVVKVMDFGIAQQAQVTLSGSRPGRSAGPWPTCLRNSTWAWAPARDFYALAASLYHMISGDLPFPGPEHLTQKDVSISAAQPGRARTRSQGRRFHGQGFCPRPRSPVPAPRSSWRPSATPDPGPSGALIPPLMSLRASSPAEYPVAGAAPARSRSWPWISGRGCQVVDDRG